MGGRFFRVTAGLNTVDNKGDTTDNESQPEETGEVGSETRFFFESLGFFYCIGEFWVFIHSGVNLPMEVIVGRISVSDEGLGGWKLKNDREIFLYEVIYFSVSHDLCELRQLFSR